MKEIAFKLKKDCKLYSDVFVSKKEKQKFNDLAKIFFEKHELIDHAEYYQMKNLGLKLNKEQQDKFSTQLKKYKDENGLCLFKLNSPLNKEWVADVTSKIDFSTLNKSRFWYFGYLNGRGKYALWDYEENVYGYLSHNSDCDIKLSEGMIPIKMSEYHSIKESIMDKTQSEG